MPTLPPGTADLSLTKAPTPPSRCNMERDAFLAAVETTREHIRAGDIFQLVLSQRFERATYADPFEVYRSLRVVNPSPYMAYMQVCFIISVRCKKAASGEHVSLRGLHADVFVLVPAHCVLCRAVPTLLSLRRSLWVLQPAPYMQVCL